MQTTEKQKIFGREAVPSAHLVELAVCVFLIGIFSFMFVNALEWELEAGLFPRIVSGFGVLSVLAYLSQLIWQRRKGGEATKLRILDIPWAKIGGDQAGLRKQALGIIAWALAFWLGVVLVGFHIAAPAYLYSQLVIYGRVRIWIAMLGAGLCLLLIDLVYDRLAGTTWNDPVLFDLVRAFFST